MILPSDEEMERKLSEFADKHIAEWGSEPSMRDKCRVIANATAEEIFHRIGKCHGSDELATLLEQLRREIKGE